MCKHIVLFDDACPMCQSQMKILSRLDWFGALSIVPLSDPQAQKVAPAISREDLLDAIHCITPEGRIYRGSRAFRFFGMRLPLLAPLAIFLWIPGVIFPAEIIYRWVSRNRLFLSRIFGCETTCAASSKSRP